MFHASKIQSQTPALFVFISVVVDSLDLQIAQCGGSTRSNLGFQFFDLGNQLEVHPCLVHLSALRGLFLSVVHALIYAGSLPRRFAEA